jgi:ABC-type transport system involved in multi-copper enzyme maturation permease subunit
MGMILIYGLILLFIFSVIGIGLFIYSRKKKSKIGLAISILIVLLVILSLFTNTIDEVSISKKDIVSDLRHINIVLKDDFKITKNNVTGMPERIQETEIKISQKDKDRIINEIKHSANFKLFANEQELTNDSDTEQFGTSDKVFNFKYPECYSREAYTKIDNYPTKLFVLIYEKSNTIKYQRIED